MKSYTDGNKLPVMVTVLARHDKVVSCETSGFMHDGKPMQTNAISRIASMTKLITNDAVMVLSDEGLFQLDDPVCKEFREIIYQSIK